MNPSEDTIVLDLGGFNVKAGYAGVNLPEVTFPSYIAKFRLDKKKGPAKPYVGSDALARRQEMSLDLPIVDGVIINWNDAETLLDHCFFTKMKLSRDDLDNLPVLMTEGPLNTAAMREKIAKLMFEKYDVPAFYMAPSPVLSLLTAKEPERQLTGLVLESSHDITTAVPVYEGHVLRHGIKSMDFAGYDATVYLKDKFRQMPSLGLNQKGDRPMIEKLKHKFGRFAFKHEPENISYTLPDDRVIEMSSEILQYGEPLFNPEIAGAWGEPVHKLIYESISACDREIQGKLYKNIQLSGGNALMPGFADRLKRELVNVAPPGTKINVYEPTTPVTKGFKGEMSAWLGGSLLGAKDEFEDIWVSKQEYDEFGPSIMHASCF